MTTRSKRYCAWESLRVVQEHVLLRQPRFEGWQTRSVRSIKLARMTSQLPTITANAVAGTQGRVDASVESLDEDIEAFVTHNTPSLGEDVWGYGYSFIRQAHETPILKRPSGREVILDLINHTP